MRLSWAQGAVVALSFTAAIGLLGAPARLLGPPSVAGNQLSLPRASTPSIVIAALPTPQLPARVRHANRPRPATASSKLAAVVSPSPLEQPPTGAAQQSLADPAAVIVAPRRRNPPDDPPTAPAPAPTPAPAPQPTPAPTDPTTPDPTPDPTTPALPPAAAPLPGPVTPPPVLTPAPTPAGDPSGGNGGCPAASANGQGGSHDDEHGHEPQGNACGHNG